LPKYTQSVVQEPYKYKAAARFKEISDSSPDQRCQKLRKFKHLAKCLNENYFVTETYPKPSPFVYTIVLN